MCMRVCMYVCVSVCVCVCVFVCAWRVLRTLVQNDVAMQVCHSNPSERSRFIRCIYNLLSSGSLAVRYEAAGTLVTLSNAPSAIKV